MSDSIQYMFEIVIDALPFLKASTKKKIPKETSKNSVSFVNAVSEYIIILFKYNNCLTLI